MRLLVTSMRGLMRAQGVLLGLIYLMTMLFALQSLGPIGWDDPLMATPAKIMASWHQLLAGAAGIRDWLEFGTLISCSLLHGSIEHLTGNMLYYWGFGALISELLGWRWLLGVVLLTALGASVTHVALNREEMIPMIGASGVVAGFMGAYLGLSVRWHLPDPHVWPLARPVPPAHLAILAVFFIALDYKELLSGAQGMTAYGAHVGGFTSGLFLTCFITPRPRTARPR